MILWKITCIDIYTLIFIIIQRNKYNVSFDMLLKCLQWFFLWFIKMKIVQKICYDCRICAILRVSSSSDTKYHQFPRSLDLKEKWLKACHLSPTHSRKDFKFTAFFWANQWDKCFFTNFYWSPIGKVFEIESRMTISAEILNHLDQYIFTL